MSMKRIGVLFGVCIIGLYSSLVLAADPSDFSRKGLYVGGGGIYAIENFSSGSYTNSEGFNFRLGYRLHPHVAIEAAGEHALGFDRKPRSLSRLDIDTWVATLNGKFFALSGQFQPYGLVGVGAMTGKTRSRRTSTSTSGSTDVAFRIGGGVDVYATSSWVLDLGVSYVSPTGDVDNLDYLALGGGIQYRF